MLMQGFLQMLQYLIATQSIDVTVGDFNYELLKKLENKFLDIFTYHFKVVNKQANISGSLIYYVCINKTLMKEFFTNATV